MRLRVVTTAALATLAAGGLTACGSQGNDFEGQTGNIARGAQLFAERCAGCHTMDNVGAQGGAVKINDREKVDGPNFNVRPEDVETVLYAIRNGGYSGAIMPENLVVGEDAQAVAEFLAEYGGYQRKASAGAEFPAGDEAGTGSDAAGGSGAAGPTESGPADEAGE